MLVIVCSLTYECIHDLDLLANISSLCTRALMDLYIPVYPLKGYAMSLSAKQVLSSTALKASDLPSRIVCDKYMFTTRLGDDEIRITSIGEFSGWSTQPTPKGK